jgi:hypothetical protein
MLAILIILGIAILLCMAVDQMRVRDPANWILKIVIVVIALVIVAQRAGLLHRF